MERWLNKPYGISIHALREEGDALAVSLPVRAVGFLSTPSARRATTVTYADDMPNFKFLSTPSARRATKSPTSHHRSV